MARIEVVREKMNEARRKDPVKLAKYKKELKELEASFGAQTNLVVRGFSFVFVWCML